MVTQEVTPPEVEAYAASVAAAIAPPALPPSSPILPSLCPNQLRSHFPPSRIAAAAAAPAAAGVRCSRSQSQVVGLRAVTHAWPRPLSFI